MKFEDRLAHQVQAGRGSVKKFLGRATGNSRLEAEGRREQARGNLKRAADKLRDAFKR
ncbi:CsbD family protein [Nocardia beijingensis]|uniref:CsbD family protein n=1 Tax=Nocardia beijingensis TaxID=95162 RepID=A0ABW7WHW3_9NOCA|nr:CsbD family protein [Nocardia beijingensis]MBF6074415.1 CsbD family protein [Nocardia beijingensis]